MPVLMMLSLNHNTCLWAHIVLVVSEVWLFIPVSGQLLDGGHFALIPSELPTHTLLQSNTAVVVELRACGCVQSSSKNSGFTVS